MAPTTVTYTTTTTTTSSADAKAALAIIAFVTIGIIIVYLIPFIIVQWKMFKKAGRGGWEVLIPFYNTYVFGLISKKPMWVVWCAVAASVAGVIPAVGTYLSIFSLIFGVILLVGFIKQYQASVGFWVCYILFPFIALFLVNKVTYTGGQATGFAPGTQPAGGVPGAAGPVPPQPMAGPVVASQTPVATQAPATPTQPVQPVQPGVQAQPVPPAQPVQPVVNPMPPTPDAGGQPGGTPPTPPAA